MDSRKFYTRETYVHIYIYNELWVENLLNFVRCFNLSLIEICFNLMFNMLIMNIQGFQLRFWDEFSLQIKNSVFCIHSKLVIVQWTTIVGKNTVKSSLCIVWSGLQYTIQWQSTHIKLDINIRYFDDLMLYICLLNNPVKGYNMSVSNI